MLLSWTHFLPTASLSSSSSYVFSVSGMFYDICFLWGLRVQITIRKNTQRDTLRMQNWPDVCVCVCVCARALMCVCARARVRAVYKIFWEILKVLANFQLAASVISPCLSVFPQLCYISLPLSFCTIVSVSASVSHACPPSAPTIFSRISQCEKSPRVFLLGFVRTGSPYLMKWLSC